MAYQHLWLKHRDATKRDGRLFILLEAHCATFRTRRTKTLRFNL